MMTSPLAFDHAVIMVRDRLDELAPDYAAQGFHLSEPSRHNIGSCNRLIVLHDAYLELLGWPPGAPARAEIAASPLGLEALVFRSHNAQATHQRLHAAGYCVNPMQELTRPVQVHDGNTLAIARFQTVRFARQPIAGLRLYFCQHLTPQYVWQPTLMKHANGAQRIHHINIIAPDAHHLAAQLGQVIDMVPDPTDTQASPTCATLKLDNLALHIHTDKALTQPRLAGLSVQGAEGAAWPLRITSG